MIEWLFAMKKNQTNQEYLKKIRKNQEFVKIKTGKTAFLRKNQDKKNRNF